MPAPVSRRGFLAGSAALMTLAGVLAARGALPARESRLVPGPYGPLRPARDLATGLPLILLPEGFEYRTFSWTGDPLSNGAPAPEAHDGMGVIAARGKGAAREIVLVRNHECVAGCAILAPARYDVALPDDPELAPAGGTTTLRFRGREWVSAEPSLGGTIYNCAGGVTPWHTWLSCEETVVDLSARGGRRHGYVFEVREDPRATTGRPIVAMGRMVHEAVAIDPKTNIAYLTEDEPQQSGFYRFLPANAQGGAGSYEAGGRLQAARVIGRRNADLRSPRFGDRHRVEWIDIADPDAGPGPAPREIEETSSVASGPFLQAWAGGGLRMCRGEGICHHDGRILVVDTEAGVDAAGRPGHGEGALWEYDPAASTLTAIFVSTGERVGNNIDNVTASPRGGIVLCEDGDGAAIDGGLSPPTRLIGVTQDGDSYELARNNVNLAPESIAGSGKRVLPGDYRAEEWAGTCFDPEGQVLFANIQRPGITFAIWGPWERGEL